MNYLIAAIIGLWLRLGDKLCPHLCESWCSYREVDAFNDGYKMGYQDGKAGEEPMPPIP